MRGGVMENALVSHQGAADKLFCTDSFCRGFCSVAIANASSNLDASIACGFCSGPNTNGTFFNHYTSSFHNN